MATAFYGADIQDLRDFAAKLGAAGQQLSSVSSQLSVALAITAWTGPDARQFAADWNGPLGSHVQSATVALETASLSIRSQADQQQAASTDTMAAGSGSPIPPLSTNPPRGHGRPDQGATDYDLPWREIVTDPWGILHPNWQDSDHAPTSLDWLLQDSGLAEPLGNGLRALGIVNSADDAIDLLKHIPTKPVTFGVGALGAGSLILGVGDVITGISYGDPFRAVDGGVNAALALATFTPIAPYTAVADLVWSTGQLASGDVPLTKRMYDLSVPVTQWIWDSGALVIDALPQIDPLDALTSVSPLVDDLVSPLKAIWP